MYIPYIILLLLRCMTGEISTDGTRSKRADHRTAVGRIDHTHADAVQLAAGQTRALCLGGAHAVASSSEARSRSLYIVDLREPSSSQSMHARQQEVAAV